MKNVRTEKRAAQGVSQSVEPALSAAFDWWLFAIMLSILGMGLVMVFSASGIVAEQMNGDKYYFFKRQLVFALFGVAGLWVAALLPRAWLYKMQYPALFFTLLLMLITLSPYAPVINGAKRWIPIGLFSYSPWNLLK